MAKGTHPARPARFAILVALAAAVVTAFALLAGSGTASSSAAPTNTSRPTISGTARAGDTLTGSPGTWSGTEPISYSYQWHRCSSSVSDCHAIAGANGKTYTLTATDVGKRLVFSVRAS